MISFFGVTKNMVWKEENANNRHFLLFPRWFKMSTMFKKCLPHKWSFKKQDRKVIEV